MGRLAYIGRLGVGLGVALINGYQRWISPMLAPRCRFAPSCSEYAKQAVLRYGLIGGGVRALWRLLRCHPFHPSGYDPLR